MQSGRAPVARMFLRATRRYLMFGAIMVVMALLGAWGITQEGVTRIAAIVTLTLAFFGLVALLVLVVSMSGGRVNLLMWSCSENDLHMVRVVLSRGIDINAVDKEGYSALMYAIEKADVVVIETLLDEGASPNLSVARSGLTPLMMAAASGRREVVQCLLDHGADVHAIDHKGRTAVDRARAAGHHEIVDIGLRGA